MEANKILSAPLIDLIFDGRNKNYGAYELRKTDSTRTRKALSGTIAVVALIFWGVTMANSSRKKEVNYKIGPTVELAKIDEKPPEELPKPEKQPEPEPVETVKFTPPEIVPDDQYDQPPPDQSDLDSARIGLENIKGTVDSGFVAPPAGPGTDVTGIITPKETEPDEPLSIVEVPAKFVGSWEKFLLKNLNPQTPTDNGAGPGRYSVVIQFVVDKEGNVSDINPLTKHGYGLEEEAIRVLKKAPKWEPAIQNGHKVKAYHRQIITFEVPEE